MLQTGSPVDEVLEVPGLAGYLAVLVQVLEVVALGQVGLVGSPEGAGVLLAAVLEVLVVVSALLFVVVELLPPRESLVLVVLDLAVVVPVAKGLVLVPLLGVQVGGGLGSGGVLVPLSSGLGGFRVVAGEALRGGVLQTLLELPLRSVLQASDLVVGQLVLVPPVVVDGFRAAESLGGGQLVALLVLSGVLVEAGLDGSAAALVLGLVAGHGGHSLGGAVGAVAAVAGAGGVGADLLSAVVLLVGHVAVGVGGGGGFVVVSGGLLGEVLGQPDGLVPAALLLQVAGVLAVVVHGAVVGSLPGLVHPAVGETVLAFLGLLLGSVGLPLRVLDGLLLVRLGPGHL